MLKMDVEQIDEDKVFYTVFKLTIMNLHNLFEMTNQLVILDGDGSFKMCIKNVIVSNKIYYDFGASREAFDAWKSEYLIKVNELFPDNVVFYEKNLEKFYRLCVIFKKNLDELTSISPQIVHVFTELLTGLSSEMNQIFASGANSNKLPLASIIYNTLQYNE
jgi:hypothetical protein